MVLGTSGEGAPQWNFSTLLLCVGASVVHLIDQDVVANSSRTAAAGIRWVCLVLRSRGGVLYPNCQEGCVARPLLTSASSLVCS